MSKEQIYTIPVSVAFEEAVLDKSCPFCKMRKKLCENEIELILGASMMEPDTRIKTNKKGFCKTHFEKLLTGGKALPFALMTESHVQTVRDSLKGAGALSAFFAKSDIEYIEELSSSCYICERADYHFYRMVDTTLFLWESDPDMKKKFSSLGFICLSHYALLLKSAKEKLTKKLFPDFHKEAWKVMDKSLETVSDNISAFAKQFDYRHSGERVSDEVKAAPRSAVRLFVGDFDT